MSVDVEGLYRRFGPMVLRRCRQLLKEEELAVDAMQDTFVQVLRARDRLTGDAPSSLLYRVATNVCLNRIRSRRRHPEDPGAELLDRIAACDEPAGRAEARTFLQRIFAREKPSTRTIAVLHLLAGVRLVVGAGVGGLGVAGVRTRWRTLRGRLAELEEVSA